MAFELEALVGHLYIFGGRTININPPGALVEIAPRSAARGREGDTFFVLILPSGDVAPTTFYEQMAKLASERYFNVSGSVTSALRTMFQIINRNLYEHNQGDQQKKYEASIIVGVLHDEDLYVGRVGSALSILQTNGLTLTFPEDISNDETLFNVPLGVQPVPDVKMARYAINAGTRLLLSDVNLAEIPIEKLTHTLAGSDIEQVLDSLQTTINVQAQLMVVEFVPPEEESTVLAAPGESSTEINTKLGEARVQVMQEQQRNRQSRGRGIEEGAKRRVGKVAGQTAKGLTIFSRLFERFLPPPDPEAERRISSGTITLAVLVIPIVIMAIVVVSWASDIGETDYEQCLGELLQTVDLARSIDSADRRGVMAAWNAALLLVNECEGLRPGDPTVQAMRTAAQDVMDTLNNIKRRPATPLASFENASITRLRLSGLDMYALDAANDLVYRIKINGEGNGVVLQEPIPNLRRGATVDGLTVGNIVDIAFDDLSGNVAIIDSAGVLVRCSPSFIMNCNAQRVLAVEQWQHPTALKIWSGRLYVLDTEGGQIWRYDPSGGTYASAPREYFTEGARPNLRNVVDFTISLSGTIYLMYDDGVMKSYITGQDRPFSFSGFNDGRELNVVTTQGFYLNDSPIDPAFFIISQPARTIFETTLAGTFIDSYQVFDEDKLALLSAIVAYPTQNILYVASGNTIFTIQKGD